MRRIILTTVLLVFSLSLFSQNWQPLGRGTSCAVRKIFGDTINKHIMINP